MKKPVVSLLLPSVCLLLACAACSAQQQPKEPKERPLPSIEPAPAPQVPGELEKRSIFLNNTSASKVYYYKLEKGKWALDSLKPQERKHFYPLDSLLVRLSTNKAVMQYLLIPGAVYFTEWDKGAKKWVIVKAAKRSD
jgi:hypothetical protein